MSWNSINGFRNSDAFRTAFHLLSNERRVAVEHALIKASQAMRGFTERRAPLLWPSLPEDDGKALDTAVRTQIALGVFRATFGDTYTYDSVPITEAVDVSAAAIDTRAAELVLGRFGRTHSLLQGIDAAQPAAFHQALDRLMQEHGMDVMRIATVATDAALAIDTVLEAAYGNAAVLDVQLSGIRRGASDTMQAHAASKNIPIQHAGALWVLAMRGRASSFGQEERTQMYTEFHESDEDDELFF